MEERCECCDLPTYSCGKQQEIKEIKEERKIEKEYQEMLNRWCE